MGKSLKYFGLVLLLLLGMFTPLVNAYLFRGTLGEMDLSGREQYQRTFFSNYSNKFYMIFDYDDIFHGWSIQYSYSDYGVTWSPALDLWNRSRDVPPEWGVNMGLKNFDFYLEPDGRYIHFANISFSNRGWYWKMEINAITGLISPITDTPQLFIQGVGWSGSWRLRDEISITVDSSGFPYIGGEIWDGATQNAYAVWKSKYNNGTWLTEDFDDFWHIESEWIANGGGNLGNYAWGGELHPSYNDNIVLIYWHYNQPAGQQFHKSMYYDASADDWINCAGSIFNDNEGGDWAEDCWSTGYSLQANISVMFKQKESNPNLVIGISGIVLNHTTYTWGSSFQVAFNEVGDAGSTVFNPFVTVSNSGAVNFVWTIANNVTYWARRMYPNGTLENNWFVVEDMFNDMIEDNQFSVADTAPVYSPMPMLMMDDIGGNLDQDFIYFNYLDFLLGNWSVPFEYYNTTLYNSDDSVNDGWLFMGEVYNLVTYIRNMTTFYLELDDGVNVIRFTYTDATKSLNVECDELVAGLVYANVETINATLRIYELTWRFILNKGIVDVPSDGIITYYGEDSEGSYVSGTAITGLHIYNLGGHVYYDMQGDGGRVTGGDWLEVFQTNGTGATTGAYAEIIYRRLQHVHVLWSLDVEDNACFDDDGGTGYVYMGIKYLNSLGNWVDGWYMRVRINKGAVDPNDKAWVTITVQWYARDVDGVVSLIGTSQYLSGYPECGDKVGADITRTRFYTDLWFNTANSSTTVGGRLNTYYFGMDKTGFLLWTDWSPIMLNMTESMMFTDLRDVNGDILNPSEIELMKFWVRVLKVSDGTCDAHTWSIRNPQISYQMADDRMGALNTPDGVETIIVDMPSTGWMQPIAKAIEGISNAIWAGALNFMKIMLGAVDSLLVFLNSPVSMSQMIQWIMLQASSITSWMAYVIEYISSMLSIFSSMITVLTSIMNWAVSAVSWVLVYVVGFPIAILSFFAQILSGEPTVTLYNLTFDFSSVSDLIIGTREIAPLGIGFMYMSWLFWGNVSMKGEIDEERIFSRVMQTFGWFRTVYNDMFWIFNRMRNEIISLYNFIRSHIPSLGGGGGEVDES